MSSKLGYLPDEHQFAIAAVAARAAELDNAIDRLIYLLMDQSDPVAEFILKNLNADRLVELLRTIFVSRLPAQEKHLKILFDKIKTGRGERNHVLHWLSETTEAADVVRFADKRAFRTAQPKDLTATDIHKIAGKLHECYAELIEWFNYANWYLEVSAHGTREQLSQPPHWAAPRALRQPNKPQQRGRRRQRPPQK